MNRRMGRAKGETHHHEEERWVSLRSTHPTRCGRRRSMAYAAVSGRQRAPRMSLFRTKSIEQSIADAVEPGHALKRPLSAWDMLILGVAVPVGAGIFSVGARAAGAFAGPTVTVAFVRAALGRALAIIGAAPFPTTHPLARRP